MESATIGKTSEEGVAVSWRRSAWMVGVILFIASFPAPRQWNFLIDFDFCAGFGAFWGALVGAFLSISGGIDEKNPRLLLMGLALITGWLANLTIFVRLPTPLAFLAIIAPWILYGYLLFLAEPTPTDMVDFFPFYPWAIGIALIHISTLFEVKPNLERRTPWTGF
jgi:hypothetical protein